LPESSGGAEREREGTTTLLSAICALRLLCISITRHDAVLDPRPRASQVDEELGKIDEGIFGFTRPVGRPRLQRPKGA
jgi:hypothetical protein